MATNPTLKCKTPNVCQPWDFSAQGRTDTYASLLQQESLNIAGATINVHKLLGIHEQQRLVDLAGNGKALSGGDAPNYPAANAFTTTANEWRSRQTGTQAISASAYIGYDFGEVKIANGRRRYGVDANVRVHIASMKIKQSANPLLRVAKVRIERSDDNVQWYGVAVVDLPNDDVLNTVTFKSSAPNRYWRLRPIGFVGGQCDAWGVQALELMEYEATKFDNIQDKILMENRDRDYSQPAIACRGFYDIVAPMMDLGQFGAAWQDTYTIKLNFGHCIEKLGRPVIIGDIIELPSEAQYTPDLREVKRFLEVTDVTWDSSSYTPGWTPTILAITAKQALASQETQDIFGDLRTMVDNSDLFATSNKKGAEYQDFSVITHNIAADAKTAVPEYGSEGSNTIREFTDEELNTAKASGFPHIRKMNFNKTGLFVEDGIPQNGAPFTEGPVLPDVANANDGDHHRLTYEGTAKDVPTRLYRYSATKNRWIYLETDRREQYNTMKNNLEEYTTNPAKIPARNIR
jgi:hypothetical protein